MVRTVYYKRARSEVRTYVSMLTQHKTRSLIWRQLRHNISLPEPHSLNQYSEHTATTGKRNRRCCRLHHHCSRRRWYHRYQAAATHRRSNSMPDLQSPMCCRSSRCKRPHPLDCWRIRSHSRSRRIRTCSRASLRRRGCPRAPVLGSNCQQELRHGLSGSQVIHTDCDSANCLISSALFQILSLLAAGSRIG